MEIERKWMVKGWPEGLPLREEFAMRQGYISVRPTVRIREEALTGGRTDYILCFKSGGGLAREEIERSIDKALFEDLEHKIIGKPLIPKLRRSYTLPDGSVLEVNHVDEGQSTEFWYAEVEYPTVEAALAWQPESCGLGDYLKDEVTNQRPEHGRILGGDKRMKKVKLKLELQYNSPVILTFFLLSLLVLFLDQWTDGWTTMHLFCVYRSSLKDPLFYIRLFGHVLGHASWDHFLNNMLLLLVVGPPMEEKYGSKPLLCGMVFTALVTGVLQCVLFPRSGLLGASGIVFMLIMLSSLAGFSGGIPVTMLLVAALYFGQQVYDIIFVHDNVANFMHIVGGLCGTAFGTTVRCTAAAGRQKR